MDTPQELAEFANADMARMNEELEAKIRGKGMIPYLPALKIGETILEIEPRKPVSDEYKGKERKLVLVKTENGKDYNWTVSPHSPVYRAILKLLPQAPVRVRVVRVGQGSDTKIDLVQLNGSETL